MWLNILIYIYFLFFIINNFISFIFINEQGDINHCIVTRQLSSNEWWWMDGVANLNQSSPFDDVDDDDADADDHNNNNNNNNNNNPLQVTTTDIQPSLILKR